MSTRVVGVPELFNPLKEFKVLLEFQLDQPIHWDILVNAIEGEGGLEDFEVLDELVFLVCVELYLVYCHIAYKG